MCLPDWTPFFNMLSTALRALGDLGDNWLNIVLLIIESTVAGDNAVGCKAPTTVGSVWTDVSGVFAERERLRVVGLTPGMYAVVISVFLPDSLALRDRASAAHPCPREASAALRIC